MTVTAEHDDDALPRPTATTDFTIGFTASGADYGAVTESFALAVLEDDSEALVVDPLALAFGEGADGEITVKLASEPAGPVTVRATLGATPDPSVTVSPATRQFTPSNWDQTKTFTVAGAEDADSDDDTATVTFAVDAGSYAAPDVPVAVTVDDIDIPSTKVTLTVVPSAGIREDVGGAVGVQVTGTLDGAPRATPTVVTVTVSSGTATAGTDFLAVADFPLTIAAGAVTGTANMSFSVHDDDIFEGDETVTVGGSTAVGLAVDPADLTILEDDVRGIALSPSAVTVTEGETAGEQYTVRLASEPTGTVTVHADAPAGSDVRVASSGAPALTASLTFTTTNWETPQPFTVTAVEDADGEDDTGLAIAHRVAGADYQGFTVDDAVAVTIDDDDVPGIQVAADPATAMVEEGQTIDLDVKLNTQPTGNVAVTLTVPSELSASSSTLTFTTGNWSTVQTVEVTALDDDDAVADGAFAIGFDASGADYGGVMESIALTVTEDDAVGVTFAPESLTVTEEGAAGTYTAVLTSAPTARVTVRPQAPAGSDVEISPAFHRFTASSWNEPKSFSVTGLDDADSDDDVVMVAHGVTGGDYDGFVPAPYAVTVTDSDVPSTEVRLIVVPAAVEEGGGAVTVTVTGELDGAHRSSPTAVTVSVGAGTGADAAGTDDFEAVTPFTLTIPANAQSGAALFTLTPENDDIDEDRETLSVSGTTTVQTEDGDPFAVVAATLAIDDDDTRGIALSQTALSIDEGGQRTYTVVLESEPTGPVNVTVGGWEGTDVTPAPALLTFIPGNWRVPQEVTLTAAEDDDAIDETLVYLTHTGASSDYAGVIGPVLHVHVTDNDTPGIVVSETALDLAEDVAATNHTGTYTVVLETEPAGTVTVTPAADAALGGAVEVNPASLDFTALNWETAQTVTVTPVQDADKRDASGRIRHTVASAGSDYAGERAAGVDVTVSDDDKSAPGAPVLTEAKPGYEEVTLVWQAPADDGGYEITGWDVSIDGGNWMSTGSTALEHTVTGRTNGQTYSFRVRAVNADGRSLPSNTLTAVPVPVIISIHVEGDGEVTEGEDACFRFESSHYAPPTQIGKEYWRAGGDFVTNDAASGRVVITGYGFGNGPLFQCWETVDDAAVEPDGTLRIKLLPGDGYVIDPDAFEAIVHINDDDDGREPGAPGAPLLRATSSETLEVRWSAPGDRGNPATILEYELRHSVDGADGAHNWTVESYGPGVDGAVLDGLAPDTDWEAGVRARNARGWSAWSSAGSGATPGTAQTVVSIARPHGAGPVTEGETVRFVVTANPAPEFDLVLPVAVTEEAAMLRGSPPSSVTVRTGTTEAFLDVETMDDAVHEGMSRVTAALAPGVGWELGQGSAQTQVLDNDEAGPEGMPGKPLDPRAEAISDRELRFAWDWPGDLARDQVEAWWVQWTAAPCDRTVSDWTGAGSSAVPAGAGLPTEDTLAAGHDAAVHFRVAAKRAGAALSPYTEPVCADTAHWTPEVALRVTDARIANGPRGNGTWDVGETVKARVTFSHRVWVDTAGGEPLLAITLDGVRREAAWSGGSGSETLSFRYPVAAADAGAVTARVLSNGLSLGGATIRNAGGEDAPLGFDAPAVVTAVEVAAPGGAWSAGEPVTVTVGFSEAVTVDTEEGTPALAVVLDGNTRRAPYTGGSGTRTLTFTYEPVADDGTATSVTVAKNALETGGGEIAGSGAMAADLRHAGTRREVAAPQPVPELSVADASVREGAGAMLNFAVTLGAAASGPVSVDYATADGTAMAGEDYTAASGTLAFAVGRDPQGDHGGGARRCPRRGAGAADADAFERVRGDDRGRDGHGDHRQHRPYAAGVAGAVRAHGGRAGARCGGGPARGVARAGREHPRRRPAARRRGAGRRGARGGGGEGAARGAHRLAAGRDLPRRRGARRRGLPGGHESRVARGDGTRLPDRDRVHLDRRERGDRVRDAVGPGRDHPFRRARRRSHARRRGLERHAGRGPELRPGHGRVGALAQPRRG